MNTRESTVLTYEFPDGSWLQVAINLNKGTMKAVRIFVEDDKVRNIDETTVMSILHTYKLKAVPSKKAKRYIQ